MPFASTFSRLASAVRSGHGRSPAARVDRRLREPLELYEYEACPACRRVREALTELDLPVRVRPSPYGGERFRPEVVARVGRARFPFLVDPNTGVEMTESDEIVAYLYATYGDGSVPAWLVGPRFLVTSQLASMLRGTAGGWARASRPPEHELRLIGDEADPAARRVRERLCELELPYLREPGRLRFMDAELDGELTDVEAILAHLARYEP